MALTMLSVPPLAFWGQSETISGVGAYIDAHLRVTHQIIIESILDLCIRETKGYLMG